MVVCAYVGGGGRWAGKESRHHPQQKRLFADPVNNQPHKLVCVRGAEIFHKEQTKYRPEGGDQGPRGGCHRWGIVSSTGYQNLPPARNRWPPQLPGNRLVFCLTRGSFANFTLLLLCDGDCLFWAAELEYLYSVSTQATV